MKTTGDFLKAKYGLEFTGELSVWTKKDKRTRYFASSEWLALESEVERLAAKDDIYIALSTQVKRLPPNQRGDTSGVSQVPGFFADIDFGDAKVSAKAYPANEARALEVLNSFRFLPTTIVATGNGLHAHFELSVPILCRTARDRDRAASLSRSFQRALLDHFRQHDLEIDSVGDLTRLYRLPGTFNHKSKPPKPVVILSTGGPRYSMDDFANIGAGSARRVSAGTKPTASHERIFRECAWYRQVVVEGAATCDEPNWFAGASITARCRDGAKHFLAYSSQHAEFNEGEALEKFRRALSDGGPRRCESIETDLAFEGCKACIHRGKISSPVQLGEGYDAGGVGPIPLGHMGSEFVFRNQRTNEIVRRTSNQLASGPSLLELSPLPFWMSRFGRRNRDGAATSVDWLAAADALIQACRSKGSIEVTSIRGIGVWRERDRLIVNMGGEVIESDIYHYTSPKRFSLLDGPVPLDQILDFLSQPNWKTDHAADLLLGWAYGSVICGALRWRPHIGITGPAQAGKSTVMRGVGLILKPLALVKEGISTEAGIRQSIGHDARPVLLDELEPENYRDRQRVERIVKLMRSSSGAEGTIARGTIEGRAINFSTKSSFMVGAINLYRVSAADTSRLVKLELERHDGGTSRTSNSRILKLLDDLDGCGPAFCQNAIHNAERVLKSIDIVHAALPVAQERHADNMATLIAASWVAKNQRIITAGEARELGVNFASVLEDQREGVELDDATEALNTLLGTTVLVTREVSTEDGSYSTRERMALGIVIAHGLQSTGPEEGEYVLAMQEHGIKQDDGGFLVSNTHPGTAKIFRGSRWEGGLASSALARVPGAKKTTQRRFSDGVRSLAVWLPASCLPPVPDRRF